ncbi:YceD family protein [Geopsychrobacter electrodiphilus]|uniref:YceD family protein n=1 Tax=Geopsychrobacter electrodiphilus TaxID=225196 RepID=UPI00036E0E14|nr:DUF177 domain-containing protein [Geopsychrobacter electrodiphilus]
MRLFIDKITDIGRPYTQVLSADEMNQQIGTGRENFLSLFVGDTYISYRLSRSEDNLLLDGEITGKFAVQCSRCLADISTDLCETFSMALFLVSDEGLTAEELELDEELINSIPVNGGEVDLTPVLTEQVLLSLPTHPLCDVSCAGLCPYCGVDRNRTSCTCEPKPFNNRFGKLVNIKVGRS